MKISLRISAYLFFVASSSVFAQQQIGNGNMEAWDNVSSSSIEPTNWNSFKTASGGLSGFASQQVWRSTAIRAGATGQYCAQVKCVSVLGVAANGNLTLGRVNMGSSTATSSSNYNYSQTNDAAFSEALTDSPDSIVFWVKYTPINSSHEARLSCQLHATYNYRDGFNVDPASAPYKVAEASLNYGTTNGQWVRKSVPFVYSGPATVHTYILATFSTNKTPGVGTANDEVLIDDVELIYNPVNQPIVANDDAVTTSQDIAAVISVLSNDSDPENAINNSSLSIVSNPTNGTVSVNTSTGQITYTPNAGYFGTDVFTYSICDGGTPVSCDQAIVTVTVNQVIVGNNQVIANNDNATTDMNLPVVIDVLANDVDPENQINISSLAVVSNPLNGTCSINTTTGDITYTPSTGYFGNDSFTYTICDAFTGAAPTCDTATVNILVNLNWGLEDMANVLHNVYYNEGNLHFSSEGNYVIYSIGGQVIQVGKASSKVQFTAPQGMYVVSWDVDGKLVTSRVVVY
jgi:hypothetical protein